MDLARSWFLKFQPRDRLRSSTKKKDSMGSGREEPCQPLSAEEASTLTKQRVTAAKHYIENHYKEQMRILQERRERKNDMHPKTRKILYSLRLRKMFSGVFVKANRGLMEILEKVEPYVTYGIIGVGSNSPSISEDTFKRMLTYKL